MRPTPDLEKLLRTLNDEAEHLIALAALLCEEGQALRALDRAALESLAVRMEAQVARHQASAIERNALLAALLPDMDSPTLTALIARGLDADGRGATLQATLRDLVRTVQHRRQANEAYARTGQRAIEGRLARILQKKSATSMTYGRAGRFSAPGVRPTLRDRG